MLVARIFGACDRKTQGWEVDGARPQGHVVQLGGEVIDVQPWGTTGLRAPRTSSILQVCYDLFPGQSDPIVHQIALHVQEAAWRILPPWLSSSGKTLWVDTRGGSATRYRRFFTSLWDVKRFGHGFVELTIFPVPRPPCWATSFLGTPSFLCLDHLAEPQVP